MSRNVSFLWDTIGFDSATLTASAAVDGWPVTNLQHPQPAKAWKCPSGQGSVEIVCTDPEMVTALAIVGHNLGVGSTVTLRSYADDLITEVASEEFEVIQPVYTAGELLACDSSAFGYPTDADLAVLPRTTAVSFLEHPQCQYKYKVDFDNGDTPFYVGRLILAKHFSPQRNMALGFRGAPMDESKTENSIGGQAYADMRKRRYQYNFQLNALTEGEVYGPLLKMHHYCGISRPLVVCLDPDSRELRQFTSIYCTLQSVPQPVCARGGKYSYTASYAVKEVL